MAAKQMKIIPITFKAAKDYVNKHHRHNKASVGWKFGIGLEKNGVLVGVATAGRPIARSFDDGFTLEINRTCTQGLKNANSMLYGAVLKISKAMGYKRVITYTQQDETGSSLKAVNFKCIKELPARESWRQSSIILESKKDVVGNGGVARQLWEIIF